MPASASDGPRLPPTSSGCCSGPHKAPLAPASSSDSLPQSLTQPNPNPPQAHLFRGQQVTPLTLHPVTSTTCHSAVLIPSAPGSVRSALLTSPSASSPL